MVRAHSDIYIHRPPDTVFAYFADLRNEPRWNRGHVTNVVMITPAPIGLGTTFEGDHLGFGRATWRIIDFRPTSSIAIEGKVGSGTYRYIGSLLPEEGGTRFQGTIEWQPGGTLKLFEPLLALVLKLQARRSFRNLRSALERTA